MAVQNKGTVDELLAESFKWLVCRQPVEKITIKEITDRAGVIRPTFYNHFQDKYELLEWIIMSSVLTPAEPLIRTGMTDEAMMFMLTAIEKEKEFYMKASRLEGQNSFEDIVIVCIQRILLEVMEEHDALKTPKSIWITPEHVAEYYAQSMGYIVMSWIKSAMAIPPKEMVEIYNYIITHSMQEVMESMREP